MTIKNIASAFGFAAIGLLFFCLRLWQPEHQVLKHHEHLLKAASTRNWTEFAENIDEHYKDRWGQNKAVVLSQSKEVLSQFFVLEITSESPDCLISGSEGIVSCHLKIVGKGSPLADLAIEEVNALKTPFTFRWTRQSWKPWDWKLTFADNPQLNIPEGL